MVPGFAELVEDRGDSAGVGADGGEGGEAAGEGGDLCGEVGDAGFAAGDVVAEVFDPLRGDGCGGVEAALELVGEFAGDGGHLVDDRDERATDLGGRGDQGLFELGAETADGGLDVADHAVEAFAGVLRGAADVFLHGGIEVREADLAFADHVAGLFGGGVEVVGEVLEHRDAGAHELEHVVALQLAFGCDLAEDQAHVLEAAAADLRGVAYRGQHALQFAALPDAGRDERGGHGGRVAQAERGALDGCERVAHDLVDALRVVFEGFELGLGAFDVQGPVEAAFGGQSDDARGDGADGADADFADFAECAADGGEDGFAAFGGAGLGAAGDGAFDGLAQAFGARADDDVAGAEVLCHRWLLSVFALSVVVHPCFGQAEASVEQCAPPVVVPASGRFRLREERVRFRPVGREAEF